MQKVLSNTGVVTMRKWYIPLVTELTEEELQKTKREIPKYPEIDDTQLSLRSWTKVALNPFNMPLNIELKRDGSNMRLFYLSTDKDGVERYGLMSRNQYAADDFITKVTRVLEQPYEALHKHQIDGAEHINILDIAREGFIVFFEFFGSGVFPGYDVDSPASIEMIDIYHPTSAFLARNAKEQIAVKYKIPIVPKLWSGEVKNFDEYWAVVRPLVEKVYRDWHKEGIVIKGFLRNYGQIFIKEKHPDVKKNANIERQEISGKLVIDERPVLDLTEINGAIKKVHTEIGDQLFDKAIAMPRIAGAVKVECAKHDRKFPRNIWELYCEYISKVQTMPDLMKMDDMEYQVEKYKERHENEEKT
jgi:hypothetical protein